MVAKPGRRVVRAHALTDSTGWNLRCICPDKWANIIAPSVLRKVTHQEALSFGKLSKAAKPAGRQDGAHPASFIDLPSQSPPWQLSDEACMHFNPAYVP
jgi:hypothetical protein